MSKQRPPNDVLIAIMNNKEDWAILHEQLWYRIPEENAPNIVKMRELKILAFYHTSIFKADLKWKIVKYGVVKSIELVSRQDLFPNEPSMISKKADRRYYKIELEELITFDEPIVSERGHRLTFVTTSKARFLTYKSLNYLFNSSKLEDDLFKHFLDNKISAERQWWIKAPNNQNYFLDFAIFCKDRNINVECDGNAYHNEPDQVHYDKTRNNELERMGWSVLRYTTKHLTELKAESMKNLYATIKQNGGYLTAAEPKIPYFVKEKTPQLNLFLRDRKPFGSGKIPPQYGKP
jgi:very-short-patch-repair endonuclease